MDKWREQFEAYTPDYVIDDIDYYFQKIENWKLDVFTLYNAKALVNLAVVSSRITKEQGKVIKDKINCIKETYT